MPTAFNSISNPQQLPQYQQLQQQQQGGWGTAPGYQPGGYSTFDSYASGMQGAPGQSPPQHTPMPAPQGGGVASSSPMTPTGQVSPNYQYQPAQPQQLAQPQQGAPGPGAPGPGGGPADALDWSGQPRQAQQQAPYNFQYQGDPWPTLTTQQPRTPNEAQQTIQQIYNSLMGRPANEGEIDFLTSLMMLEGDKALTPQRLATLVSSYPEAQQRFQQAQQGRPDSTVYGGYQFQSQAPGPYQHFDLSQIPAYQAGTLAQFRAPDHQAAEGQIYQNIQNLLANPHSLDETTVNQIKASQQQGALQMQQQLQEALRQGVAGRGLSQAGGQAQGQQRQLGQDVATGLLGSYRDIDVAAAERRRADEIAALQAADAGLGGQLGRAAGAYQTGLQGQLAQEGLYQAAAQSGQSALDRFLQDRQFGAGFDMARAGFGFDVERAQAADQQAAAGSAANAYQFDVGAGMQRDQMAFQQWLAQQGLSFDQLQSEQDLTMKYMQFLENRRQYDLGYGLNLSQMQHGQGFDWARLNEQIRQANNQLGFNYNQLNQNAFSRLFPGLF